MHTEHTEKDKVETWTFSTSPGRDADYLILIINLKPMKPFLSLILIMILHLSCEKKTSIPVITTNSLTEINTTSAVSGGYISSEGGAAIISKGICWNTSDDPTTANNKTIETGESASFTSNLTQLTPKTLYYVRAYATNSAGTGYGESISFTTTGDIPVPVSNDASDITINTAILNGTVNPNSLSTTVAFEWGTSASYGNIATPTQNIITGNTAVSISVNLTELTPGTTYHYKIKATNELGVKYSDDKTFTTMGQKPTVIVNDISDLQVNDVVLNGSVNPNYLQTTVSFEWGFTTNYGNTLSISQNSISGNSLLDINADLSGLNSETTYHFRIKATNLLGTTYSEDQTFTTYALKDADNNLYHSITIGSQTWMKTNLETTHYKDNTNIPLITEDSEWYNLLTSAYCWYNNDETAYKDTYGALYNWYSVSSGKLCPAGWHIPSDLEWMTLINYLGGESIAGTKLKESGIIHWTGSNPYATNVSGFTALPAGVRGTNGVFGNLSLGAFFWHSTEYATWGGQITYIQYYPNAYIEPFDKVNGASVRCIKD